MEIKLEIPFKHHFFHNLNIHGIFLKFSLSFAPIFWPLLFFYTKFLNHYWKWRSGTIVHAVLYKVKWIIVLLICFLFISEKTHNICIFENKNNWKNLRWTPGILNFIFVQWFIYEKKILSNSSWFIWIWNCWKKNLCVQLNTIH